MVPEGSGGMNGNDDDGDGLSNTREAELGTDPNLWDTDGDGLNDMEESNTGNVCQAK